MTALVLLAALAAALIGHAMYRTAKERVYRVGMSRIIVRWLAGKPWHGQALTDAGFRRQGTRALTRTGHASRFYHRPQWQRALIRTSKAVFMLVLGYGLLFARGATVLAIEIAVPVGLAAAAALGWLRWRARKHRKHYLYPLQKALAPQLRMAVTGKPQEWLKIPPDRSSARIMLPSGFMPSPHEQKMIEGTVIAKLGKPDLEPKWKLAGSRPELMLLPSQPPPKTVPLADVMTAIERARQDELVLGVGRKGALVKVSLAGDSPHIGLSVGSGGGKSVTAELLAAQAAYRGAVVLVLDFPKLVSLPALRGLPNVAYADSAALVHSACVWLAHELEDRAMTVKERTDADGVLHARLDRLLVIAEESNALMSRLRHYWNDIRERGDPTRSPAIDGLELALFMGRQLNVNVVQIGQMLSVRAAGSGEARENLGVRILGRATVNNWKVMVPEHPYPGKTVKPGRVHVVTDNCVECQIAGITHREARAMATAGVVTECPSGMPGRRRVLVPMGAPSLPGPEQGSPNAVPPIGTPPALLPGGISLKEAFEGGLVPGPTLWAVRKRAQRDGQHPKPVARRGRADLYSPEEMAAYGEGLGQ